MTNLAREARGIYTAAYAAVADAETIMTQTIPSKPGYLTDDEYEFILTRDSRQCVMYEFCSDSGGTGPLEYCDQSIDFDHHHPLFLGGDNSFVNLRLLCASENRGRSIEPTTYWAASNYWDGAFNAKELRYVQAVSGYQAIMDDSQASCVLTQFRDSLLQTTTLMVGATGTGKAITLFSVLFAINKVVNAHGPARPRARHVLWLTTEETLRDMTRRDLEDDPYALGLVNARPIVRVAKSYNDLVRGPCGADVIVACPHSLWWVTDFKNGVRRTDCELRKALALYDVVVFDECDFAGEQVQRISVLARHALKFALTASPPIMAGADRNRQANFLSRFSIISDDAVADYTRAVQFDGCLKEMPEGKGNFIVVAAHDGYESLLRGARDLVKNGKADPSHPVYLAAIIRAIIDADGEEQEMMALMPDDWYSPEVIVRLDRISDIRALQSTLPEIIKGLYDLGKISGFGWGVSAVYQGHHRHCSAEERDLAAKSGEEWLHPFMRPKNHLGRADHKSKRVLLMINIALRGLNNWPIKYVVDCTDRTSEAEETQLKGRGIRLPNHLTKHWSDINLRRFIKMETYIPQSVETDAKISTLNETSKFLHDMLPIIGGAGFRTWGDIADGRDQASATLPQIDPTALPLTQTDKLRLMAGLGAAIAGAPQPDAVTPDDLKPIVNDLVDKLKPEATGKRRERAVRYTVDLINNPKFRREETFAPDERRSIEIDPVRVTTHLRPKEVYSLDELLRKVEGDQSYAPLRAEYVAALQAGDRLVVDAVSRQHRDDDRLSYREPPRVFKLNAAPQKDGALSGVVADLSNDLKECDEIDHRQYGDVAQAVFTAAAALFGVDNAQNDGPLDQHAYHVEIMGRQRSRITKIAIGILAERGVVRNIAALGRLE